jgi:hypothetical protein
MIFPNFSIAGKRALCHPYLRQGGRKLTGTEIQPKLELNLPPDQHSSRK